MDRILTNNIEDSYEIGIGIREEVALFAVLRLLNREYNFENLEVRCDDHTGIYYVNINEPFRQHVFERPYDVINFLNGFYIGLLSANKNDILSEGG